jgi:hypothetical protein
MTQIVTDAISSIITCLVLCYCVAGFGVISERRSLTTKLFSEHTEDEKKPEQHHWQKMSDIATIQSPWMSIHGERLQDDGGQLLDYWRVEKPDSAVILTMQNGKFIFPKGTYRPGVGRATLDFPGGRVPENTQPVDAVPEILYRELGVTENDVGSIMQLNAEGWPINSSFSNQLLYGFVAEIREDATLDSAKLHPILFDKSDDIQVLLSELTCLQCRSVLLDWLWLDGIQQSRSS